MERSGAGWWRRARAITAQKYQIRDDRRCRGRLCAEASCRHHRGDGGGWSGRTSTIAAVVRLRMAAEEAWETPEPWRLITAGVGGQHPRPVPPAAAALVSVSPGAQRGRRGAPPHDSSSDDPPPHSRPDGGFLTRLGGSGPGRGASASCGCCSSSAAALDDIIAASDSLRADGEAGPPAERSGGAQGRAHAFWRAGAQAGRRGHARLNYLFILK